MPAKTFPGIPDSRILQGIPGINRPRQEGKATVSVLSTALGTGARSAIVLSLFMKLKKHVVLGKVVRQFSCLCVCHGLVDKH